MNLEPKLLTDFEETPSKSFINDIDYQRTQGIVAMFPTVAGTKWKTNREIRDTREYKRRLQDLSAEERVKIFGLVRRIGIEGASKQLGIKRYVIEDLIRGNQRQQAHEDWKLRRAFISGQNKAEQQEHDQEHAQNTQIERLEQPKQPTQSEQSEAVRKTAVSINEPKKNEAVVTEPVVTEQTEVNSQTKKSIDFTLEERDRILKRVAEVGMSQAAREFNTTRWVIMNWRDKLKKKQEQIRAEKVKAEGKEVKPETVPSIKRTETVVASTAPVIPTQETALLATSDLKLRVENARLKEKIISLTQEIERLRGAISVLTNY